MFEKVFAPARRELDSRLEILASATRVEVSDGTFQVAFAERVEVPGQASAPTPIEQAGVVTGRKISTGQ